MMKGIIMTIVSPVMAKKVVLGLSGGVDSTTACLFLQEKGYEVTGLYFNVLSEKCLHCEKSKTEGLKRAERAAHELGIELIYRDFSREFESVVMKVFCKEYMSGRTPNPCIVCNPAIKFKALIDAADEIGADYIATGHYAGTYRDEDSDTWHIKIAKNVAKDQSYMLYRLPQEVISRLILPLDSIESKEEVRRHAESMSLFNAKASDSQEICFIDPEDSYEKFIERMGYEIVSGNFVNKEGEVLGSHKGIANYTIGQRKGLGIALGKPAFVTEINAAENTVTLGNNEDLFKKEIKSRCNVFSGNLREGMKVKAKIRYAAKPSGGTIRHIDENEIIFTFDEPQRAPTPGQSIVFYADDVVMGGGFIV